MIVSRWLQRCACAGGAALIALVAGGCGPNSTAPAVTAIPARDGTCVARAVNPATCVHVVAPARPGILDSEVSGWVGRTLGVPGELHRYDLHDCSLPGGSAVGLVCTFWPGAPTSAVTNLVRRLDEARLFRAVQIAAPGGAPTSG